MPGVTVGSFERPDETRTPPRARIDVVVLGGITAGRLMFLPGWRWSTDMRPLVGTERCGSRHIGAVVTGRLHVLHADGSETEVGPGDAYAIEPGHDAWVVGDDPFIGFEFESAESYGRI
jgi:hypothetical protein